MFEKRRLKRKGAEGQGIVTAAKKNGGQRGPDGTRTTVTYDVTVRMRFEDGGEYEKSFEIGGLLGTSLSFGPGDVVPVRYDANDHSKFIVDERKMIDEQKASLSGANRAEEQWAQERVEEAEQNLPPNP